MTTQVRRFWPALERVVGLSAVEAEWRRLLREELEWAQAAGMIRRGGDLAHCYPRASGDPSPLPYDVVKHGDDDYVGVCPEGWGSLPLTREQLVLWALDRRRLTEAIAVALGVSPSFEPDIQPFTSKVGTYGSGPTAQPVYLIIGFDREHVIAATRALALRRDRAVLLLPTRRLVTDDCHRDMRQGRMCFAALSELLPAAGVDGRFVLTQALGQLLARRRPASARRTEGDPPRPDGYYLPGTIVWHGRRYECELSKKEAQFFAVAHANDETDAQQLMYKGKGAVWNQRYSNVKPKRDLIAKLISRVNEKFAEATPRVPIVFALRRGYDCIDREDLAPDPQDAPPGFPR
jgi:hypothetical protein